MKYTPILTLSTILAACGSSSSPADQSDPTCKNGRVLDPMSGECIKPIQDASLEDAMLDVDAAVETRFPGIIYFTGATSDGYSLFTFDTELRRAERVADSQGSIVEFGQDPWAFSISPHFSKIAYISTRGEKNWIQMYDLQLGKNIKIAPSKSGSNITFEDEETVIYADSSETQGYRTTSIYRWDGNSSYELQNFPLQGFFMNVNVTTTDLNTSIVYQCVSKEDIEHARVTRDNYDRSINDRLELCMADIRGTDFFPMGTTNLLGSGLVLTGQPMIWGYRTSENSGEFKHELAIYALCDKEEVKSLCEIMYSDFPRIKNVTPLPQDTSFNFMVAMPDFHSILLGSKYVYDIGLREFIPLNLPPLKVDGYEIGKMLVIGFKPK